MLKDESVFGRWTVVRLHGQNKHNAYTYLCKCECGTERVLDGRVLKSGKSKSCGCLQKELVAASRTTHGHSRVGRITPEFSAWQSMIGRCYRDGSQYYHRYGGRGIKVCDRWRNSFENFLEDMGLRPYKEYSLGRIDNDGDYEPSNCRWESPEQQNNNKQRCRYHIFNGKRMTVAQIARAMGIPDKKFRRPLEAGKTIQETINHFSR